MLRENLAQHMLFWHVAIGCLIADSLGTNGAGVVFYLPAQDSIVVTHFYSSQLLTLR